MSNDGPLWRLLSCLQGFLLLSSSYNANPARQPISLVMPDRALLRCQFRRQSNPGQLLPVQEWVVPRIQIPRANPPPSPVLPDRPLLLSQSRSPPTPASPSP